MVRKIYIAILVNAVLIAVFVAGMGLRSTVLECWRRSRLCFARFFYGEDQVDKSASHMYPVLTEAQRCHIDSAIKISFVGDLILLRDAVDFSYDLRSDVVEVGVLSLFMMHYIFIYCGMTMLHIESLPAFVHLVLAMSIGVIGPISVAVMIRRCSASVAEIVFGGR